MVPPNNLDLVPGHVLHELRYAMAELQQNNEKLQKENRFLRQLQLGQEKRLQRYESPDSKQLFTRHSGEMQALQKRLRQAQERGREAERSLKETQEQLHRSQATVERLRRLAEQQKRGPREELRLQLEQEKASTLENQQKIKDLERRIELSCLSHQRQLAAERKKTLSSQTVVRVLQDELKSLTNELKEKDIELKTLKTIYGANRMPKPPARKDPDFRKKDLTAYKKLSLGFPTPALPNTGCTQYSEESPDPCFSPKEFDDLDRTPQETDKKRNQSIPCTEPGGLHGTGSKEREGGVLARVGRRGVRAQPKEHLIFAVTPPPLIVPPLGAKASSLLSEEKDGEEKLEDLGCRQEVLQPLNLQPN